MIAVFLAIGAAATAAMFFIQTGDWLLALVLFVIVQFSVAATFVFYDSLLPHIATHQEIDRVSTTGYALGYLGGGLLLALNLAWIEFPHWFGLPHGTGLSDAQKTLPAPWRFCLSPSGGSYFRFRFSSEFRNRQSCALKGGGTGRSLRLVFVQMREMLRGLRQYKQAGLMLVAFLIYNEGIGTIIKMAAIYGAEIGLDQGAMIGSILLVQFVGIPSTILFGAMAGKVGAKPSIFIGLTVYVGIALSSLRHAIGDAFSSPGPFSGNGTGWHSGPEPVDVCQPNS